MDGDATCQSVAAAAILAKTVRDRLMHRLAGRYPGYGWETNVGYGTPEHHEGLSIHGPTRHHRLTFAPLAQIELPLRCPGLHRRGGSARPLPDDLLELPQRLLIRPGRPIETPLGRDLPIDH